MSFHIDSNNRGVHSRQTGTNINYRFSLPESVKLTVDPIQTLQEKLRRVPTRSLDKLHPEKDEAHPHAEYVDEGVWKSRITFHPDLSPAVARTKTKAEATVREARTYSDLDSLCDAELKRRYPDYQLITGIGASLKNRFPNLARLVLGTEGFYKKLTQKEINKFKKQIAYSACNRDDLKSCPKIEDPLLRQQLDLRNDAILQTDHVFAKNSPMNGQSFVLDGKTVLLTQAIACSNDRKVENTGNLRVVQTKEKESICYTGRADSDHKALEQASFVFLNELKTKGKGITRTVDERGNTLYQIDYVVNSLMSAPWISSTESMIAPFPEREYLENERKAFQKLKESGPITIEDPNCPGQKFSVKFNPILFSRSLNIFTRLEKWLPPFFTGMERSLEISDEGLDGLNSLAQQKLTALRQKLERTLSPAQKKEIELKIEGIEVSLKTLHQQQIDCNLRPEEELITRDYLCKLLEIPLIYHCKSSTDRTSISNALSSALKQWMELKLPISENVHDLIKDYRFKELFAANWVAGHQITRYARGGEGTVAGQTLNSRNLGLSLSRGISQNPAVAHLLPERYLAEFPTSEKIKASLIYIALLIPLTIFFFIPLIFMTAFRHLKYIATLGKNHRLIGPIKFSLPVLPLTLLFNFSSIFPENVLHKYSPQVKDRRLIAGGKNGGQEDDN